MRELVYDDSNVTFDTLRNLIDKSEKEFDLDLVTTAPSVVYRVVKTNGEIMTIDNPTNLPPGCAFAPRCPYASERCSESIPKLKDVSAYRADPQASRGEAGEKDTGRYGSMYHRVACLAYENPEFHIARRKG